MVFKFRNIRLQVRSVPVIGMTWPEAEKLALATTEAVKDYTKEVALYESTLESSEERAKFAKFKEHSDDFLKFGGTLLSLIEKKTNEDLAEVARLVREVCPVKAELVEKALQELVEYQSSEAAILLKEMVAARNVLFAVIGLGSALGLLLAGALAWLLGNTTAVSINRVSFKLKQNTQALTLSANTVASTGETLAGTMQEQAAAIQQTVSALHEINAMVSRNSENANESQVAATLSLKLSAQGKSEIERLQTEIESIDSENNSLLETVADGNKEIAKIEHIIQEIGEKTKIINDIVFQTRLLSFNASVEAARAGEYGKGFSVVAEEVGNLAQLSGKASLEIRDLISRSQELTSQIVEETRSKVQQQSGKTRQTIAAGKDSARACDTVLQQIFDSAEELNKKVTDITFASKEQATGVDEITSAMNTIDSITQKNMSLSQQTVKAGQRMRDRVVVLNGLAQELLLQVEGNNGNLSEDTSHTVRQLSQEDHQEDQEEELDERENEKPLLRAA